MKYFKIKHSSLLICMLCIFLLPNKSYAFSLEDVEKKADELSKHSFKSPKTTLPNEFKQLAFADYQKITFNKSKTYWQNDNSPFRLAFYHQGMYFDHRVKINEIIDNKVQEIKYHAGYFDTSALNIKEKDGVVDGFAGFKVQYAINDPKKLDDEIFSALGASYFRVIGKNQVYGLSARALAINTGLISGEEFPYFKEFWLEKPKPNQKNFVIYALLDSPSVTGAYKITLTPHNAMIVDIESSVFFRKKVEKLGIAPLTSMYLYGKNQPSSISNYRPELHDSNGLSIWTDDKKWIWRPLNNPERLSLSSFALKGISGFGLIQRDDGFDDYQDLDDHYEKRPSAWIEPQNNWGAGHVELVELPTPDETNDNIIAFWVPEKQYQPGDKLYTKYRVYFTQLEASRYPNDVARVKNTFYSLGDIKQANLIRKLDGTISYVVDFVGDKLSRLPKDAHIKPFVNISDNGKLIDSKLVYNDVDKGWRVILRFNVKKADQPTEIYVSLVSDDGKNTQLSETWNAQYLDY
ncbi:glucan biosynthesis protein G [Orbus wheelerorum]|uniref:glucan biosynthesis protein G n=1 Tax=Orbus wheelerorum TaxID=3074111 RepID=UPI00370DAD4E